MIEPDDVPDIPCPVCRTPFPSRFCLNLHLVVAHDEADLTP